MKLGKCVSVTILSQAELTQVVVVGDAVAKATTASTVAIDKLENCISTEVQLETNVKAGEGHSDTHTVFYNWPRDLLGDLFWSS